LDSGERVNHCLAYRTGTNEVNSSDIYTVWKVGKILVRAGKSEEVESAWIAGAATTGQISCEDLTEYFAGTDGSSG
jgi:hypothetical protein